MGSVDSGIHAMAWSPDQDLVVLITGNKIGGAFLIDPNY